MILKDYVWILNCADKTCVLNTTINALQKNQDVVITETFNVINQFQIYVFGMEYHVWI